MTALESSEVMPQVVASPTNVILTTLEVSFMLLKNIYDDRHTQSSYIYSTGVHFLINLERASKLVCLSPGKPFRPCVLTLCLLGTFIGYEENEVL
jgi:hypothetical protein